MEISDLTLEALLPHRKRMLLVGEIIEVDREHAVTRTTVSDSCPLCQGSKVHPLILLELAAQTAGVCNGWDRIQTQGLESENIGWLVGIKKAEFFIEHITTGTILLVKSENTHKFGNLREIASEVYIEKTLIAKITLQLFKP